MDPTLTESNSPEWTRILIPAFLGILAVDFLAFGPALSFDFLVRSDDQAYIYRNPFLKDLSWDNLAAIFSANHFGTYFPVTLVSFSLDHTLWGRNPFGYHLTQILLHALNTFLVLAILLQAGAPRLVAIGTAFLFTVHPVHVEGVAWVASRKNLLTAFFVLLSIFFYVRHTGRSGKTGASYGFCFLSFILSLLTQAIAVMLPVVMVLYDLCVVRRGWKIAEKIPFFLGSLAAGLIAVYTHWETGEIREYYGGSFAVSALFTLRIYWDYLGSLALPFSLSPHYFHQKSQLLGVAGIVALVLVPLTIVGALFRLRSHPFFSFAVGWFVVWLLPVSNLMPVAKLRHDRYLYLPSLALFFMLAYFLFRSPWFRADVRRGWVVVGILVVLWGGMSGQYALTFASSRALWERVAQTQPDWPEAQFEAGLQAWRVGDRDGALTYYRKALMNDPENAPAWNNLGAISLEEGQYGRARAFLERAVLANPDFPDTYRNLAVLAYRTGTDLDRIPRWKARYDRARSAKPKKRYHLGPFQMR